MTFQVGWGCFIYRMVEHHLPEGQPSRIRGNKGGKQHYSVTEYRLLLKHNVLSSLVKQVLVQRVNIIWNDLDCTQPTLVLHGHDCDIFRETAVRAAIAVGSVRRFQEAS